MPKNLMRYRQRSRPAGTPSKLSVYISVAVDCYLSWDNMYGFFILYMLRYVFLPLAGNKKSDNNQHGSGTRYRNTQSDTRKAPLQSYAKEPAQGNAQ